jgi:hypothetical protein
VRAIPFTRWPEGCDADRIAEYHELEQSVATMKSQIRDARLRMKSIRDGGYGKLIRTLAASTNQPEE